VRSSAALIGAFGLGAASVLGFSPFDWFPLPILALALLLGLWQRAGNARRAAAVGLAFGLGYFLAGVSWVYVSLHEFGAMPAPLAALATLLFCAYLAAFPAAVGYGFMAMPGASSVKLAMLFPAVWTLAEWVRGWLFTGFPWLALGYSQVPLSPLAGYAPVLGIYGVTLATAATAGLIVAAASPLLEKKREGNAGASPFRLPPSAFLLALLWLGGWALLHVEWTAREGAPVSVSLLQGNVPQDLKWRPERVGATLEAYRQLAQSTSSQLIILPETALPLFIGEVPQAYLAELAAHALRNRGDILIGAPERLSGGEYFNSVLSYGASPTQHYRKSHLVPFGEFIPLRPLLGAIVTVLSIPLQDFSRGAPDQQPLRVAGLRVAINICYEDAFGEEIIRQLPAANVLANVSNVAWFGRSIAPQQHLQISQARALETGRYMLRATNTGTTAVIDQRGRVVKRAPEFTRAIVTHDVPGHHGETPYVRWGNNAVLALCALLVAVAIGVVRARRTR
jgi:apolipoprotein N-acyltransferase